MAEVLQAPGAEVETGLVRERVPAPTLRRPGASRRAGTGLIAAIGTAVADRRGFVLLPFAMTAGVIVSAQLPAEPQATLLGAGAALIGAALLVCRKALGPLRAIALLAAAWAGFCLLPIHGALWGTQMLQRPAYGTYQATVDEILSETQSEKRIVVSAIEAVGDSRPLPVRRARLLVKSELDLSPGDRIEGPFRFAPVPGPVYPGGFDTQFHAYFDGIGAYGNSTRPPALVQPGNESTPAYIIDAVRRGISTRIDAVLSQPAAGIARAIINGDQSAVTDDARETMAAAGIAHVLSVSGLHLTIAAGGVFWVVRLLLSGFDQIASRVSAKRIAASAGIAAAVAYFAISGGNVAAFRSTLMIILVFGAVLVGRQIGRAHV